MMKPAGAIIRVSTAKQLDGTSPEKQIETIFEFAHNQGYEISPDHLWQSAESGSLKSEYREGFQHALKASTKGEIVRIYVFSLDRLGRDLIEMLMFLRDLKDRGVDCWEAEHRQQLHHDDLVVMILGAVASNERKQIIARTQDGLLRSIAAGKYSGGIIAYGYQINPVSKQLEINEQEAGVIRMVYQWCVEEYLSCFKIAERLNALNVPTHYAKDDRKVRKGKRDPEKTLGVWRHGQVLRILKNQAYTGHWQYGKHSKKTNKQLIAGFSPTIITEETYTLAQEVLRRNTLFNGRNVRKQYLLRGLIRCGICGRAFCGNYSRLAPHKQTERSYYSCNGQRLWRRIRIQEPCGNMSLRAEEIEMVVWEDVKAFCINPEIALAQLRTQRKPFDEILAERLNVAIKQMDELKRKELNLLRIASASTEVDTSVLDTVLAENHHAQKSLQTYITSLQAERLKSRSLEEDLAKAASRLARLAERIDNATYEEKRQAIEDLVKNIVVTPQEIDGKRVPVVTITYRFNEPCPDLPDYPVPEEDSVMITSHTPAPAAITATRFAPAPVPQPWSLSIKNASPALCSTALTSISRCRGWNTRN